MNTVPPPDNVEDVLELRQRVDQAADLGGDPEKLRVVHEILHSGATITAEARVEILNKIDEAMVQGSGLRIFDEQ